jgi:hypothetical protein
MEEQNIYRRIAGGHRPSTRRRGFTFDNSGARSRQREFAKRYLVLGAYDGLAFGFDRTCGKTINPAQSGLATGNRLLGDYDLGTSRHNRKRTQFE